jgi:folate-binding protein YgfZ
MVYVRTHKNMIPEGMSLFESPPGALIRVTGDDAFGFLQGQFTNELRQAPGSATYGLWLNQKGKVLADSHVLRISEKEFLVVSANSAAGVIRQRLDDYIVADDVSLTDETAGAGGLLVAGAGSEAVIGRIVGEVPGPGLFVQQAGFFVFRSRRLPGECLEVVGAAEAVRTLQQRLIAERIAAVKFADVEFARISAGISIVPSDIGPGDLPNEGGLDESAISYTKGCYLGQEVMARLKNLGQVRRRLHVVQGRGSPPAALAALHQDGKKIGEIRSVATHGQEFVALAMLSLINLKPGQGLALEPAGPATLTVLRHG